MNRAARTAGPRLWAASLALCLGAGCGWLPVDLFRDPAEEAAPRPPLPPPLENCEVLSILIDASRRGDPKITERARAAMSGEFRRFGATITDSPEDAYWSLMILGTQNSRRDGFIVNVLLTARSGTESGGPGMSVFSRSGPGADEASEPEVNAGGEASDGAGPSRPPAAPAGAVPTLYSGIAFGPHAQLARRSRELSRQAYAAIYPAARRMCDYEASEQRRERELQEQFPPPPDPL